MDILFKNNRLKKACTQAKQILKQWPSKRSKRIRRRLDDLRAAENLDVMRLLPGRCHELRNIRKLQLSLHLDGPYRLIFEPADNPVPTKVDGGLDWSEVRSIRILGVEDTHD
ncbi:MAG: killer suppression protein [Deltaproteobacteria bacterium]|nr:killer suppression protein [Deltaproteobacteria bacterium]